MDSPTASTDPTAPHQPGKALVSGGVTFLHNHQANAHSHSAQTSNGRTTVNTHDSGSAACFGGTAGSVHGGPVMSKGLPPSPHTVIQTPQNNSRSVVSPTPTVTLVRPPGHSPGSGLTLNGNSAASPPALQGGPCVEPQSVNNGQKSGSASVSLGSLIIKAEPQTTVIQAPGAVPSPRAPAGGVRAMPPQALAPRLPQTSTGQPSIHNFQLPPGMVLVRSESGQLLMIPQQALAQMQAQAQGANLATRAVTPTTVPPGQAPGGGVTSRAVAPSSSSIIRQGCPVLTSITATTALHRPPGLQSSVGAAVPGMTTRPVSQTSGGAVSPLAVSKETMENVKKCKNFLSSLIKLASSGKRSTDNAASVKELVKDLLEGILEAEEFTSRLYKELNSSPQPYLVPFLKRSLPALRQLTPDSAAFIHQSHAPQPAPGSASSPSTTTVVLSSPAPRLPTPVSRPPLQLGTNKTGPVASLVLQPQQPMAMLRPRVPTSPMMTLRNQSPGCIMLGQQHMPVPRRVEAPPLSGLTPAQRNRLREAGGTFKDDDDINDVASMAGVNLSEESANIMATSSSVVGSVTRSCKDEAFLSLSVLQRRMLETGRRYGVTELGADVVNAVSLAAQQRLQNLFEKVSLVAQQKNFNFKEDENYEQNSDVRSQLKFFEQIDLLEKQRKEEQEREILLKAAKSRARQEDPEQLRLKQKAKEMQQQELAQMRQREANLTALAAIGPRKKRKMLDSPSASAASEASGSGSSLGGGASSSGSRTARQRITRVNLRDLLLCLENERINSPSHFLYKGFLK